MSKERDERPLAEIRFAQDVTISGVEAETTIRTYFERIGVKVAQDIIDLGCTGLVSKLRETSIAPGSSWDTAQYIRRNMSGSICGLPCYVPRDRFCLVHNTIGGLQTAGNTDGPQAPRYSEVLTLMSRDLTSEEQRTVAIIAAKLAADAKAKALADYGAEEIEEPTDAIHYTGTGPVTLNEPAPSCPIPQPPFKCPDHKEPDWGCRKCIAQAIVEGHGDVQSAVLADGSKRYDTLEVSLSELLDGEWKTVELWVKVASWSQKVTRD